MPKFREIRNREEFLRAVVCGIVAAKLMFTCPPAQSREPRGPSPVRVVQTFLLDLYPELANRHLVLSLSAWGPLERSWGILSALEVNVTPLAPGQSVMALSKEGHPTRLVNEAILAASFQMHPDGGVNRLGVNGPFVNSQKNEEIRKNIDAHQEWTDEQVIRALKEAGASYGPDQREAVIEKIQLLHLERLLGKFTIKSAGFHLRSQSRENFQGADLFWEIDLTPQSVRHRKMIYAVFVEPFEGKPYMIFENRAND